MIRPASACDEEAVKELLALSGLPAAGLDETRLFVLEEGGDVVGCVGYEAYEPYALLRSLAVHPAHRGTGRGRKLMRFAVNEARSRGFEQALGLTSSIPDWLLRLGFSETRREELPVELSASTQMGDICKTARAFYLNL
ncbi:MAG: GNAT family N-acetyltransferase [Deinococcus sp.]|nr:GNAT family N-acetyltransferase [Deinococcus sp.]